MTLGKGMVARGRIFHFFAYSPSACTISHVIYVFVFFCFFFFHFLMSIPMFNSLCRNQKTVCNIYNPTVQFTILYKVISQYSCFLLGYVGAPAPSAIPITNCPISPLLGGSGISQKSLFPWISSRHIGQVLLTSLLSRESIILKLGNAVKLVNGHLLVHCPFLSTL